MKDENDKFREGNLGPDPFADADPMGHDMGGAGPDDDDLDRLAPTMANAYRVNQLFHDRNRELVSLESLPTAAEQRHDHGWGQSLDQLVGGGICPGYVLALGAKSAGAGKTGFIMQVADGLALRTAELIETKAPGPLSPVIILSEMGAAPLSWRSIARWCDYDSRIFRAGRTAIRVVPGLTREEVALAYEAAERALTLELFGRARHFMRIVTNPPGHGLSLLTALRSNVKTWRDELADKFQRNVWPIIVLDPVQRWQDQTKNEVEALNELVETLQHYALNDGWVVLCTSDTNKGAAATWETRGRDTQEYTTGAIRGSYKLFHVADAVLFLHSITPEQAAEAEIDEMTRFVLAPKNRWGPQLPNWAAVAAFRWIPTRGRFVPLDPGDEAIAVTALKSRAKKDQRSQRRSSRAHEKDSDQGLDPEDLERL